MQFFLKQILCLHSTWDSFPILYQVCFVRVLVLSKRKQLLYLVPLCSVFSTVQCTLCTVYRKCGFFLCCSIWAWLVAPIFYVLFFKYFIRIGYLVFTASSTAPRSWFQWLFTFAESLLQKIIIWNCMYLWSPSWERNIWKLEVCVLLI